MIADATTAALQLLLTGDAALWEIIMISLTVSGRALLLCLPAGIAVAFLLSYLEFPGRRLVVVMFQTLMSIPAVVIGLTVYLLLARHGPFGDLKLLFTQMAMVIGQMLLSFPIIVALGYAAFQAAGRRGWETARTLGAGRLRAFFTLLHEVRFGLLAAFAAAFGRIISEVGVSMMVGGNILGYTRNIPTAIALESSKGEFAQGIALGIVLLLIALLLNLLLHVFQGREPVII
ncbi:MAG TPA: ABC transporter permease subunit [Gammaproteobacteria bacterium]|nr:ABC transporter permease subunit [Gammaproteobacteria bacterium]